ncbi:MAG: Gfo/Idh/MocA family oxidoreductase [Promethearchaeota archaeon]|nr:MAG: Gfo/Idh/MocA family oxidoreductase [Candidatus Lokiarchaeota archaeon]
MSDNKLKVGVIGCGMVANVGHLPVYNQSPLTELVAVADPSESHLKEVQHRYKVPKAYKDPNDLIDDPGIDVISICSPHWAHAEQAIRAAKNGKHILCEKPIGLSLAEVDDMIKAVEHNKIIFQTATQKRFDRGFQTLKEKIMEKDIGDVFHASVFWYHSMPFIETKPSNELVKEVGLWRITDDRCGGGDLLDHGPHYFDLFRWWFGDINTVSAQIRRIHESRVNEDHSAVQLSFKENETVAIFERSEAFFGTVWGEEKGRIHGTNGTYYFEVPPEYFLKPMTLKKYFRKEKTSKPSEIEYNFSKERWNVSYAREVRSFINQVLGRSNEDVGFPEEWIPTIKDGRAGLEIVLASYESQRTQKTIKLPLENHEPLYWDKKSC